MKKLLTIILTLAAMTLATKAQSVTIAGIDDVNLLDSSGVVSTSNHNFITVTSTGSGVVPANHASIGEVLTDTSEPLATYVFSLESGAYIDIGFGDSVTANDQLVLFFAGGNSGSGGSVIINFDIEINGILSENITPFIPLDGNGMVTTITDVDGWPYSITAAVIDLSLFGLAPGEEMDAMRIFMADAGSNYPALAGVGYIAAIPIPLPLVLFGSGLAALGLFTRRR